MQPSLAWCVFGSCRAAIDVLPGGKTAIFASMPGGKRRDARDEPTKAIGAYIYSGRHVLPNGGQTAGWRVLRRSVDAISVQNLTKLLLSRFASTHTA